MPNQICFTLLLCKQDMSTLYRPCVRAVCEKGKYVKLYNFIMLFFAYVCVSHQLIKKNKRAKNSNGRCHTGIISANVYIHIWGNIPLKLGMKFDQFIMKWG